MVDQHGWSRFLLVTAWLIDRPTCLIHLYDLYRTISDNTIITLFGNFHLTHSGILQIKNSTHNMSAFSFSTKLFLYDIFLQARQPRQTLFVLKIAERKRRTRRVQFRRGSRIFRKGNVVGSCPQSTCIWRSKSNLWPYYCLLWC